MNSIRSILVAGCLYITTLSPAQAQTQIDSTGLPGDHFSLPGALEMFKKASSLEDFEKNLNSETNSVNNLDLNGDGEIDYVRVSDQTEKNAHAIVLQVAISETESQDVAVIEIEKNGDESAVLQIVGDDELYEDNTIVEPFSEKEVKPAKGPAFKELATKVVIINVWFWPCVRFIYAPIYTPWVSPWYWHHYPLWWKPWRPYPWYLHYKHCSPYKMNHQIVYTHRVMVAHTLYAPHRRTSVIVATRFKSAHESRAVYRSNHAAEHPVRAANKQGHQNRQENVHKNQHGAARNNGGGQAKGNKGGRGGRK